jgi:hypothetical protein
MKRIPLLLTAVIFTAGCGLYTACKNDCPSQPPVLPPGHTALTLTAKQVSTRWLTLQWKNDSTAVSRAYVLLRNGKDTVFANTTAITSDTITVKDSSLTPSTRYSYTLYRVYQNQHWDSATAQVHTLDTTKDNYQWTVTKLGIPGTTLYCVWGTTPNSVWAGGGLDSGDILHYYNGQLQEINVGVFQIYSVTGTSDSNVWFGANGALVQWNGNKFTIHDFISDSLPRVTQNFTGIWIAPDSEMFVSCSGGSIVHRSTNGKWDTMSSGTKFGLGSIIGFAPNDVYAAGGYASDYIVLHYDGSTWSTILQDNGSVNVDAIGSLWGESADSLYIVGNGIFHRKGSSWENRTPTQLTGYAYSVHSQGWNNVFVAGDYGTLIKFDGDHWIAYNLVAHANGTSLNGVINFNNDVFAVGLDNNSAYFIHGQ